MTGTAPAATDAGTGFRLLRAHAAGETAFWEAFDAARVDPEGFLGFLGHRLRPWLLPTLRGPRGRDRFPESLIEATRDGGDAQRPTTAHVVADALDVHAALERARLPWMLLKGLAFAGRLYGGLDRRYQRDTDVLVRARDRDAAVAALATIGFQPEDARVGEGAVRRGLVRGRSALDLHWNLRRRAAGLDEGRLWEAPSSFEVDGTRFSTLSDAMALTFLLLSICGDVRRGAPADRQLLDAYLLLRTVDATFDWGGFWRERAEQGIERPCANALALLLAAWDAWADVPRVVAEVCARRSQVEIRDSREALALLTRPRGSPANERWFRRAHPHSAVGAVARRFTVDLPRTVWRALRPASLPPRS